MSALFLRTISTTLLILCSAFTYADNITLWVSSQDGLVSMAMDKQSGALSNPVITQAKMKNRFGFLAKHPNKDIIYTLDSGENGASQLHAYQIDAQGNTALINSLLGLPRGSAHVQINPQGTSLAVSFYGGGYTGLYSLKKDGSLNTTILEAKHTGRSVNEGRQRSPHPHGSVFNKDGTIAHVTDLGTDHIWSYKIKNNKKAKLFNKVKMPGGFGPRHIVFDANYQYAYVTDELVGGVSVLKNNAKGKLEVVQNVSQANQAAIEPWANTSDVQIHPNGKFLYVLNRGFDQATVYKINSTDGTLRFVENEPVRGSIARHCAIDPSGKWMIITGAASGTVAVFAIKDDGRLDYTKNIQSVPKPMSIVIQ